MEKYIIQLQMIVNGEVGTYYHENISNQKNNQAINVYVEQVTKIKKDAKVFYVKEEAIRIGALFSSQNKLVTVLTIK